MTNSTETSHKQDHVTMVAALVKSGSELLAALTPSKCNLWHMSTGIAGEAGELLDSTSLENMLEELGDLEFYIEGLKQEMQSILGDSYDQITLTAPEGFTYPDPIKGVVIWADNILDLIKKYVVYNKDLPDFDIMEAIAQLEFAMSYLYAEFESKGITKENALAHNIHKLLKSDKARYKLGVYTDKQAQDRADKEEDSETSHY